MTRKRHDKKRVINGSTRITRNRHVWHANLFVSTWNDPLNTTHLTRITNKYLFYFGFVKYLLYPTYILNLKRKASNYKNLQGILLKIETLQTLDLLILFFFGIELAQMKLDELVEDVMNLDINKESVDDNRGHSQD